MRLAPSFSLVVAGLALVAAGCGPAETPAPSGFDEARAEAARRGVPVLVEFFTDW